MDCDSVVKVALRRCIIDHHQQSHKLICLILLTAHFDSNGKALKQLIAPRADDVNTDDAFFWPDNHELEQRWLLVFRGDHGEVESAER